jgi:hypothetical protein
MAWSMMSQATLGATTLIMAISAWADLLPALSMM